MSSKTIATLCATTLAAIGIAAPSASGAGAQGAEASRWCPDGVPCERSRDRGRLVPTQVRPKIQPQLTRDSRGRDVYRSGGWLME